MVGGGALRSGSQSGRRLERATSRSAREHCHQASHLSETDRQVRRNRPQAVLQLASARHPHRPTFLPVAQGCRSIPELKRSSQERSATFVTDAPVALFNRVVDYQRAAPIFNHMVELEASGLDAVFHALGDATRRQMLRDLTGGERTVSQLAEPFAMSLAAASKHIKALENAGLIRREVRGRTHLCRLAPESLASAHH